MGGRDCVATPSLMKSNWNWALERRRKKNATESGALIGRFALTLVVLIRWFFFLERRGGEGWGVRTNKSVLRILLWRHFGPMRAQLAITARPLTAGSVFISFRLNIAKAPFESGQNTRLKRQRNPVKKNPVKPDNHYWGKLCWLEQRETRFDHDSDNSFDVIMEIIITVESFLVSSN